MVISKTLFVLLSFFFVFKVQAERDLIDTCSKKNVKLYYSILEKKRDGTKKKSYTLLPRYIQKESSFLKKVYFESQTKEIDKIKVLYQSRIKKNFKNFDVSELKEDKLFRVNSLFYKKFLDVYGGFNGVLTFTFFKKDEVFCIWEQKINPLELDYSRSAP